MARDNMPMRIRRPNRAASAIWAIAISAVVAGCGSAPTDTPFSADVTGTSTPEPTATGTPATSAAASGPVAESQTPGSGLPDFSHVYVIIMENKSYRSIVGAGNAPYLNSLIARYGLATNLDAETHPSEPNYIALVSGGLQGTTLDLTYNLKAPSLFDQIETAGRTWHVYAQSYPGNCYKASTASGFADGPGSVGDYARKHNPAISFVSISANATRCANITRLTGFNPAAADFEMIIPNLINDMHSSSTRAGDDFLKAFVPKITSSPAFANSLLIITWDEGAESDKAGGGGHIATIFASPGMKPGSKFTGAATHYSILRTIELAWGLPLLGDAAKASSIELPY